MSQPRRAVRFASYANTRYFPRDRARWQKYTNVIARRGHERKQFLYKPVKTRVSRADLGTRFSVRFAENPLALAFLCSTSHCNRGVATVNHGRHNEAPCCSECLVMERKREREISRFNVNQLAHRVALFITRATSAVLYANSSSAEYVL